MDTIVGVVRGTDKAACFGELRALTNFDEILRQAVEDSGKAIDDFKIVIKPNMMVFITYKDYEATVTDPVLVELLIAHLRALGFRNIAVCEAQNDVGRMLKHHTVAFVAEKIGYRPEGCYTIADLTREAEPFTYVYTDKTGRQHTWKDKVGTTWKEADFRITFAKCKTHEYDWMTLGVKNVYGCLPRADKVQRYHIKKEVWDVTARSLASFPVHFSFIDGWIASDGFQGYKIGHPKALHMLFGGSDLVAVDMEVFERAGLDPRRSRMLRRTVALLYEDVFPDYVVKGDKQTLFKQVCDWENIKDDIVKKYDHLEEVYIVWAFWSMPAATHIDYTLFPPKNVLYRFGVWLMKKLYGIYKLFR